MGWARRGRGNVSSLTKTLLLLLFSMRIRSWLKVKLVRIGTELGMDIDMHTNLLCIYTLTTVTSD